MDNESILEILRATLIGVAIITVILLQYKAARANINSIVNSWVLKNDFEILAVKRCFYSGAFKFRDRNQEVVFVTIRDRQGQKRGAWLRCQHGWQIFIFRSDGGYVQDVIWKES